jgi:hypothetical protein
VNTGAPHSMDRGRRPEKGKQTGGAPVFTVLSRPSCVVRMIRIARIVVPGARRHVTQRGDRRQALFPGPQDYALYRDWLAESRGKFGLAVWAYCLMPDPFISFSRRSTALALARARPLRRFQRAGAPERAFVSGVLRIGGDGRGSSDGGGALRRAQSGQDASRRTGAGLAAFERAGAPRSARQRSLSGSTKIILLRRQALARSRRRHRGRAERRPS